jgi:hypothetical protein
MKKRKGNMDISDEKFKRKEIGDLKEQVLKELVDIHRESLMMKKLITMSNMHEGSSEGLKVVQARFSHLLNNWGMSVFVFLVRTQDKDSVKIAKLIEYVGQVLTECSEIVKKESG